MMRRDARVARKREEEAAQVMMIWFDYLSIYFYIFAIYMFELPYLFYLPRYA